MIQTSINENDECEKGDQVTPSYTHGDHCIQDSLTLKKKLGLIGNGIKKKKNMREDSLGSYGSIDKLLEVSGSILHILMKSRHH